MDTRKFFKFINAIYNGYYRNINALCDGKLDIEDYNGVVKDDCYCYGHDDDEEDEDTK